MKPVDETTIERTPRDEGFAWPAEWDVHESTWLAWPHNRETWPGAFESIPNDFANLVAAIACFEPVDVLVNHERDVDDAKCLVNRACDQRGGAFSVRFRVVPTDDAWVRDCGPVFVRSTQGRVALTNWHYDAWGGKYPPFDNDNQLPCRIAELVRQERFDAPLVLEGGAIDGNGGGVALTTTDCLMARNPQMTQTDVEQILARYLGVTQLVWLRGGAIEGDDTDGHVDQLARFVNSQTVVVAWDRSQRGGAEILRQNERLLQSLVVNSQPLNVVRLPLPSPLFHNEHPLPASYCNFYFVNGGLIVPTFDNNADDNALATLAELCPGCQVVGVNARSLVWGLGAVHCLTQQQPKGTAT